MTGNPVHLLHALAERPEVRDLIYISNNVGEAGMGGGRLLRNRQIRRAVGSFFSSNREVVRAAMEGALEVELLPQGTLAEALRAGGAGIGGFFTPTAAATALGEHLETRVIDGVSQVFQPAIRGDIAFIRAWRADTAGNLQYRMTEQNFNPAMATAARLVVAEVEEIVEAGSLDPNHIHTPACFVDFLVQAPLRVEHLGSSASGSAGGDEIDAARLLMARAALAELRPGEVVNLGIGIPTLVADLLEPAHDITLHTENGMLGVGPSPRSGGALDYPVNAGKQPVSAIPGTSYFDSCASFGMIRGGHVDAAIMGGLQVDEQANLANWAVPGKPVLGVGGAMDLACSARRLIVTMTHTDRDGAPKIVEKCTLPLTASGAVDVLITEKCVFRFDDQTMRLTRLMPGVTLDDVRASTLARFEVVLK